MLKYSICILLCLIFRMNALADIKTLRVNSKEHEIYINEKPLNSTITEIIETAYYADRDAVALTDKQVDEIKLKFKFINTSLQAIFKKKLIKLSNASLRGSVCLYLTALDYLWKVKMQHEKKEDIISKNISFISLKIHNYYLTPQIKDPEWERRFITETKIDGEN